MEPSFHRGVFVVRLQVQTHLAFPGRTSLLVLTCCSLRRRHPILIHGQCTCRGWGDRGVQHRGQARPALLHAHRKSHFVLIPPPPLFACREIPIVHRVIKAHTEVGSGMQRVLTKGDNNYGDDRVLYAPGQDWLHREHIMGRAVGFLPHVGRVTIIMNDYPYIKVRVTMPAAPTFRGRNCRSLLNLPSRSWP
jgi:hypothetical protein